MSLQTVPGWDISPMYVCRMAGYAFLPDGWDHEQRPRKRIGKDMRSIGVSVTPSLRSGAGCGPAESRRTRVHGEGRHACRNHRGGCLGWGPAMRISCAMRTMPESPIVPFDHNPRMDALCILLHTACWPQRSLQDCLGRGTRRHTIRRRVDVSALLPVGTGVLAACTVHLCRDLRKAWLPGGAVSTAVWTQPTLGGTAALRQAARCPVAGFTSHYVPQTQSWNNLSHLALF